jgi:hypothetical protein
MIGHDSALAKYSARPAVFLPGIGPAAEKGKNNLAMAALLSRSLSTDEKHSLRWKVHEPRSLLSNGRFSADVVRAEAAAVICVSANRDGFD